MPPDSTRREFLGRTARGALVLAAGAAALADACAPDPPALPPAALTAAQRATLAAAMDEIIPAADGMPAATAVGAVEYAERLAARVPAVAASLGAALAALDRARFPRLPRADRVAALAALERSAPPAFAALRDVTYEAYYTSPRVFTLLGYDPAPTDRPGPRMAPFDPALLARVAAGPRRWREVG